MGRLMVSRCRVLHFSGHGVEGQLAFESDQSIGETQLITKEQLQGLCLSGDVNFVFVAACHSETVGRSFLQVDNINHVVAVKMSEQLNDDAALVFMSSFYNSLLNHESILQAFKRGKAQVSAMAGPGRLDAEKFLLLPEKDHEESDYHDVTLFPEEFLKNGNLEDLTPERSIKTIPIENEIFLGRAEDCSEVIKNIVDRRVVILEATEGYGKTAVMRSVAEYLFERYYFSGGIFYVNFRQQIGRSADQIDSWNLEKQFQRVFQKIKRPDHQKYDWKNKDKDESSVIRFIKNNCPSAQISNGVFLLCDHIEPLLINCGPKISKPRFTDKVNEQRKRNWDFLEDLCNETGVHILMAAKNHDLQRSFRKK
eukprot:UN32305